MLQLIMEYNLVIPLILVILGFGLIITELVLGIDSLFDLVLSGTSLIIAGATGYLFESWPISILLALMLLIAYWVMGRSYIHRMIETHPRKTNSDRLAGLETVISRVRSDGKAFFVKIDGEEWQVEAKTPLRLGDKVYVAKAQGTILRVETLN